MDIPEGLKKPPVLIGVGVVALIVIIVIAKRGQTTQTTAAVDNTGAQLATQQANVQIAQMNADIQKQQIQTTGDVTLGGYARDVSLANIQTQGQVAGAKIASDLQTTTQKIASDENVNLQSLDYSHDIANRQLEDQRILGLTMEDTKRLINTQNTTVAQNVAITQIDANRFLGELSIRSGEAIAMRQAASTDAATAAQERISDFTTSRALTYATINGSNQVAAIKANKPSTLQTIFSGLGGVAKLASVFV